MITWHQSSSRSMLCDCGGRLPAKKPHRLTTVWSRDRDGERVPSIPSPQQGKSVPFNRTSVWVLSPSPPKLQENHSHGSVRSLGRQGNCSVLPCLLGPKFQTRWCSSLQSQLRQGWISPSQCPPALSRQRIAGFREDHRIIQGKGLE